MSCRPPSAARCRASRRRRCWRRSRRTGSPPARASTSTGTTCSTTLTDVLMSAYPVVCRLVDPRFFAYAADRYIREHLPASPCLFEYGASLPGVPGRIPAVPRPRLPARRRPPRVGAARRARTPTRRRPSTRRGSPPCPPTKRPGSCCASIHRSPTSILRGPSTRSGAPTSRTRDGDVPVDLAAGGARLEIRRQRRRRRVPLARPVHLCLPPRPRPRTAPWPRPPIRPSLCRPTFPWRRPCGICSRTGSRWTSLRRRRPRRSDDAHDRNGNRAHVSLPPRGVRRHAAALPAVGVAAARSDSASPACSSGPGSTSWRAGS